MLNCVLQFISKIQKMLTTSKPFEINQKKNIVDFAILDHISKVNKLNYCLRYHLT